MFNFETQSLGLTTVVNARDLGGYVMPDGSRIRKGMLMRGGSTANASEEDLRILHDRYHLAKLFDFRTSLETGRQPDKMVEGAQYIWMPAFNEDRQVMEKMSLPPSAYEHLEDWLAENSWQPRVQKVASMLYEGMVTNDFTIMQYAGFLQNILSTEEGSVYWHCSQGKDRTGLGSALVLAALGADRDLIMMDFEISADYYKQDIERAEARVSTDAEKAVMRTFVSVNSEYFSQALDMLEKEYGSLHNFITDALLLSDEDMEILRERYLER